jgi:hypothetical protein
MSDHDLALLGAWLIGAAVCQLALTLSLVAYAAHWISQEWRATGRPAPKDGNVVAAGEGSPAATSHQGGATWR